MTPAVATASVAVAAGVDPEIAALLAVEQQEEEKNQNHLAIKEMVTAAHNQSINAPRDRGRTKLTTSEGSLLV